jgi:deoxyribonuclease V
MIAFLDACYHDTHTSVACVLAADWSDGIPARELVRVFPQAEPYMPGQFYRRELPFLLRLLEEVSSHVTAVVIDAYVWLDSQHRPGLGAHLYSALGSRTPVVGVAKTAFLGAPAIPVLRGGSRSPLFVTSQGIPPEEAATHVREMHGTFRIPTLLKRVDRLSRMPPADLPG